MPLKIKDIKSAILTKLYALYEEKGLEWSEDEATLAEGLDARPGAVEAVLMAFREEGLIDLVASDSILDVRLTVAGIEAYEDPQSDIAPYVQHITINAQQMQNVQTGHGSTMNVSYSTVLQQLVKEIEASDLEPVKKAEWIAVLHDILSNPLTQTAVTLAGAAYMASR